MGKVLVVKNSRKDIHDFAQTSYEKKTAGYYNAYDGSSNENYVKEIKEYFSDGGIILIITYDRNNTETPEDMFIGRVIEINKKNNIQYQMILHLSSLNNLSAMKSVLDKIDLDIENDFDSDCYMTMCEMEGLYNELRERIMAREYTQTFAGVEVKEENNEDYVLSPLAQQDAQSRRIYQMCNSGQGRTEFQRDRERVVNCKAFRRMVDKAQIFSAEKGDYYRTRMTHSLEVNQIAKAIAYALKLNLDLTEAIALGHDLGHTPFGHQGERTLDDILAGKVDVGICAPKEMFDERYFGGFKHNYQSAKVLTQLEEKYIEYPGLNVSVQVVEGVLKHTRLKDEISLKDFLKPEYINQITFEEGVETQICASLEGQTVAVADEIAQRGHDVDDALTSGVLTIEEFKDRLRIGKCAQLLEKIEDEIANVEKSTRIVNDKKELKIARIVSCIIKYMIDAAIQHSRSNMEQCLAMNKFTVGNRDKVVCLPPDDERVSLYLERVVQKKVICNNEVARADYNASVIVKALFAKYYSNPRLLHEGTVHKMFAETMMHENPLVASSAVNLSDTSIKIANDEISLLTREEIDYDKIKEYREKGIVKGAEKHIIIFEKRRILIRCIVDFIAGMTDGYALEEYEKLK